MLAAGKCNAGPFAAMWREADFDDDGEVDTEDASLLLIEWRDCTLTNQAEERIIVDVRQKPKGAGPFAQAL